MKNQLKPSKLSILALATLLAMGSSIYPIKVKAQEENNEEEVALPTSNNINTAPPVIIDESDSSGVSDVEEYDG